MSRPVNKGAAGNRSIAKKINNYWLNTSLGNFIAIDLIAAISSIVIRCRTEELLHGIDRLLISRYFEIAEDTGVTYFFDGYSVNLNTFFITLFGVLLTLAVSQAAMLATGAFKGSRAARQILRPIDEIAVSAQDIASSPLPEEAEKHSADVDFSDLQSAIDKVDPVAAVHVHTGNSDLKGLESAVNSLLDRMLESYRRQTQFVSDASHELRTPIAVIRGYADMLDRWGKTDGKVLDESVEAIKNESEHITMLLEQLLFLARSDNGRQSMSFEVFSLTELVSEVCSEYRLIDSTHSYICETNVDANTFGDRSLIKQTLRILTDNAKKYTPENGEITLRVRRNVQGEICFEVQDTGIGMEQSDIEHIFERFYRADPARSRDTGGSGLGLSIAKRIVDSHKGRFEVSSCVGIGTRMTVVMPKLKPDSADFILNDEKRPSSKNPARSIVIRK